MLGCSAPHLVRTIQQIQSLLNIIEISKPKTDNYGYLTKSNIGW